MILLTERLPELNLITTDLERVRDAVPAGELREELGVLILRLMAATATPPDTVPARFSSHLKD